MSPGAPRGWELLTQAPAKLRHSGRHRTGSAHVRRLVVGGRLEICRVKLEEKDGRRFWAAYVEVKEAGAEKEDRTARIACIRADCNPTDRPPAPPAEPADTKECNCCKITKPLTDFGFRKDNKNGVSRPKSLCRPCCNENERERKRKLEKENLGRGPSATKQKRG